MLELLMRWKATAVRRIKGNLSYTLGFGLIGGLTGIFNQLPDWMGRFDRMGADAFFARLPRDVAGTIAATIFLMIVLRLCTEKASTLLRRPILFVAILTVTTVAATWLGTTVHVAMSNGRLTGHPIDKLLTFWLDAMLWFGLVGWLYLLAMQRIEMRATLSGLLGKRAALGRQLAQARLGTVRAQIDPAEVAQVLVEVRARYRDDPPAASALLDELIGRLRRAMSRVRRTPPAEDVKMEHDDKENERDVADQNVS